MKLYEIKNIVAPGNETNLTGGNMPNYYKDSPSEGPRVRKKKKDVYGVGSGPTNASGQAGDGGDGASGGSGGGE